jgi:hypothetical protein
MAIGTNALVEVFGTQDTLGTTSGSVVNDAFSVAGDLSTWTNTDDAPRASVTLSATFSVAPTQGSVVNLFLRLLDVQSTNDQEIPDADYGHVYVGSFPVNNVTSAQYQAIDISLPNGSTSQQYEFYVENKSGQSMSAGWDIYVTPKTYGPSA